MCPFKIMNDIGILIITSARVGQLRLCIESLKGHGIDVFVVVNGSDEPAIRYLRETSVSFPGLAFETIEKKVAKSRARNLGFAHMKSDIVYCIDDDAFVAGDTIAVLRRMVVENPQVAAIGGPNLTPPQSTYFQRISGYIFSTAFTAWKMRSRYAPAAGNTACDDTMLALCNMALRKSVLEKEGIFFDERLHYNEENHLLSRLKSKGYRLLYCPGLVVYHERRNTVWSFARQIYGSGKGRGQMTLLMPSTFRPFHAMPTLFIVWCILAACAGKSQPFIAVPLWVYLLAGLFFSMETVIKRHENLLSVIVLLALSMVAHVSYGIGFLRGITEPLVRNKWN
jgi:GT2 family glycosyltransferase